MKELFAKSAGGSTIALRDGLVKLEIKDHFPFERSFEGKDIGHKARPMESDGRSVYVQASF